MILLIDGMSTPILIVTVANTTLSVDDGDESSFKIISFIVLAFGAWY